MVHVKDLVWQMHAKRDQANIEAIRRDVLYVPELVSLETLLSMFLDKKCHMAIIVDEFGGTLGMVTMEDVLEEMVGEIQDEFDHEQPLITQIQENEYLVDGATPCTMLRRLSGSGSTTKMMLQLWAATWWIAGRRFQPRARSGASTNSSLSYRKWKGFV